MKKNYRLDKTTSSSYRKNKGLLLIQFIIMSLQDIIPLSGLIYWTNFFNFFLNFIDSDESKSHIEPKIWFDLYTKRKNFRNNMKKNL